LLTNFDTELSLFEQALGGSFANLDDETVDENGETSKSRAINALIDHLDLQLLGKTMSSEYRNALHHYLMNSSYTNTKVNSESARRIVQDAFIFITTSSAYMIQK
jgi:hypothetical protein